MTPKHITWIILATGFCLVFGSQVPGCFSADSPKRGSVLDASTGQPIANATVIASAHFYANGLLGGSASNYPYRYITTTNAEGEFTIPPQWALRLALPGMQSHEEWLVTAIKVGYVLTGDEIAWSAFDARGRAKFSPPSTAQSPSGSFGDITMVIEPLRMHEANLTLAQFATYYQAIQRLGDPILEGNVTSEDEQLRREISNFLTPRVCALETSEELLPGTAEAILFFAVDRQLVDTTFRDEVLRDVRNGTIDKRTYQSGRVCQVMKSIGWKTTN